MSWGAGWVVTPWFLSQKVLSSVQRTFDECGLFSLPDFEDLINAFRILMSSIFSPGEQEPEAETFLDLWHAPRFSLPAILGPGHINTCKGTRRGRGGDRLGSPSPVLPTAVPRPGNHCPSKSVAAGLRSPSHLSQARGNLAVLLMLLTSGGLSIFRGALGEARG